MASSKEYLEFILGQLSELAETEKEEISKFQLYQLLQRRKYLFGLI